MDKQNEVSNIEIGVTCVTLFFVMLRITGIIVWDWLWIFAPLWTLIGFEMITGLIFLGLYKIDKGKVLNILK